MIIEIVWQNHVNQHLSSNFVFKIFSRSSDSRRL